MCETRALLGPKEDIREVRVGKADWGGREVRLLPGQSVAVSFGDPPVKLVKGSSR